MLSLLLTKMGTDYHTSFKNFWFTLSYTEQRKAHTFFGKE